MKIVVTGGKGLLGTEVVRWLEGRGATVVSASRRTGVDLATGKGLEAVLEGADRVVHAATHSIRHRSVDLDGTRRMIKILAGRSRPPHVIYISLLGCDRIPFRYHRVKYGCELELERSQLPVTVVRATQYHVLVERIARTATLGPLALVVHHMAFQPCDHRWLASELADLALGPAPSGFVRAADRAGPERLSLADAVTLLRARDGKTPPRLITLPPIGATLGAYAAGVNLPGADAKIGGPSFRGFLDR